MSLLVHTVLSITPGLKSGVRECRDGVLNPVPFPQGAHTSRLPGEVSLCSMIFWVLFFWGVGWIGCGPAHPVSSSSQEEKAQGVEQSQLTHKSNPWEAPAQYLNLKATAASSLMVVPQNLRIPGLPGWQSSLAPMDIPMRFNTHQIFIERVIHLGRLGESEVFFTWTDESLGRTLLNASATHKVLGGGNHYRGSERPVQVWHDPSDLHWMIRVSELFLNLPIYSGRQVTEADTQVLNLRLFLSNETQALVEIEFRLTASPLF